MTSPMPSGVVQLAGQLTRFMELWESRPGRTANAWISSAAGSLYIRKGFHLLGVECYATFDIAAVELQDRGRGYFTWLLGAREVEAAGCICLSLGAPGFQEGAAAWDNLGCYDEDGNERYIDGDRAWPRVVRHDVRCPVALAAKLRRLA